MLIAVTNVAFRQSKDNYDVYYNFKQRLPRTAPLRIYGRIPFVAGNSLSMSGCWAGQTRDWNVRRKPNVIKASHNAPGADL